MLFQYENQHWVVHIHFVVCLTFLTVKQQLHVGRLFVDLAIWRVRMCLIVAC
mgnify:CR=1 FL=1